MINIAIYYNILDLYCGICASIGRLNGKMAGLNSLFDNKRLL